MTMRDKIERFENLAAKACAASGIVVKDLRLLNGRRFCATFHGEEPASKAAGLLAPVLQDIVVAPGFDPGKATGIANGRRKDVRVWRVHGWLK
jgi:hypothetical protein